MATLEQLTARSSTFPDDVEQFDFLSEEIIPRIREHTKLNADGDVPICLDKPFHEMKAMVNHSDILPERPISDEQLMKEIDLVLKYSMRTGHSRFVDKLYSGSDAITQFATMLLSVVNNNCHTYHSSQILTVIEEITISNLCRLFFAGRDYPKMGGIFMPGGSYSNMMALRSARDKYFPSIRAEGTHPDGPTPVILCSSNSHYCITTTCGQIGIGTNNVVKLETNLDGSVNVEKSIPVIEGLFAQNKRPFVWSCTAGTTVHGAFDDFTAISEICKKHDMWMHVDACWGGSAVFGKEDSEQVAALFEGIENADSIAYDAHKFISTGLLCGCLLVKDESFLYDSCEPPGAKYLFHGDGSKECHDLSLKTLQCGRQCDAIKLYLSWLYYGKEGLSERVVNGMDNAAYLVERVKASPNMVLAFEPSFCNVCFWWVGDEQRQKVEEWKATEYKGDDDELFKMLESNTKRIYSNLEHSKVDYSPITGIPSFFRMITSNYRLRKSDIDVILDDIEQTAKRIL